MQFNLKGSKAIQRTKNIQKRHNLEDRACDGDERIGHFTQEAREVICMPREQENRSILVGRAGESIRCLHIFVEGVYFRVDLSGSFERPSNACYVMGYIHIGLWKGKASGTGTIWSAGFEGEGGGFRVALLKVNAMVLP